MQRVLDYSKCGKILLYKLFSIQKLGVDTIFFGSKEIEKMYQGFHKNIKQHINIKLFSTFIIK